MSVSKIEQLICDRKFSYLRPYFYNHPYALRCELGIGDGQEYLRNAKKRATEIYDLLFPQGADAIIFNYWIFDHSDCGEPEADEDTEDNINYTIKCESEQLRFLLECQTKYRHLAVRDLETYGDLDDEYIGKRRRNRIVCYSDGAGFDSDTLIEREINGNGNGVGFVSFENECIFSVYDDRGCDVVFSTKEKMQEFYHKLEPYFLLYDIEEMRKRFRA